MKPNASVALHKHSNALVDILPPEADSSISMLQADEKPEVAYADIGGYFSFLDWYLDHLFFFFMLLTNIILSKIMIQFC